MKALKYIFILLLVVIIAGAVYFSLQDGHYEVEKSETIEAPASLVFKQLEDFDNWSNWFALNRQSEVDIALNEQTSGVDSYFTFTDDDGAGKITITSLEADKSISMDVVYEHSLGSSKATMDFILSPVEKGTQLTIKSAGDQALADKVINTLTSNHPGKNYALMYEQSLVNLNKFITGEMAKYLINVDGRIDYSGGYYLYMSSSSSLRTLPKLQSQMLRNIHSFMEANSIDAYGPDMVLFEKFDDLEENAIFSVAVPVQERVITAANSRILVNFMEPQAAIKITLKGSYENLREAWKKGEDYIISNGLIRSDQPPFEIYKTDPYKTDNPANYITEVYLPVQ